MAGCFIFAALGVGVIGTMWQNRAVPVVCKVCHCEKASCAASCSEEKYVCDAMRETVPEETITTRPCPCLRNERCPLCRDTAAGRVPVTPEQAEIFERLYTECYIGHLPEVWWWKLTDWVIAYGRSK